MRFLIACFAFVFALGLAAPASAQGFPPGPWRGLWTTEASPGYAYQAELNFTIENSGRVSGSINWMLVSSPRSEDQPKIGRRGVEYVEGAFDASTGALTLHGTRVDDANGIISPDVYRLAVSPNGQYISGLTENNGTWQGRINLTRFGPQ